LSKKITINLHYGDRLSYTQAEELNLATMYIGRSMYQRIHRFRGIWWWLELL